MELVKRDLTKMRVVDQVSSVSQLVSSNPLTSESSLQIDGGPVSYNGSLTKSTSIHQVIPQGKAHQVTYPEPRIFKFGNEINLKPSLKENLDSKMKGNLMDESRCGFDTKDSVKESVAGVSVQYFNNLKMELIKTKKQLQRVLQQTHTDLNQVEMQRHIHQKMGALEEQFKGVKKERDMLLEEVKSLKTNLTFYKTKLHQNIEGATINSEPSDSLSSGCLYNSRMSEMSDSACQTSPFLRPLVSSNRSNGNNLNTEDNVTEKHMTDKRMSPDPQQVMKDSHNQIQRLTRQLEDQQLLNEQIIKENKDIKKSYQQLLKSVQDMERHQEQTDLKTKIMQLEKENVKIKKLIAEYEEDNNQFLSMIEVIQNNLCKEKDRAMQLEATLREEQRCHGLSKHNLYGMYGTLKTKYDRLAHQKNLLEQRLANSSTGGARHVVMESGGSPDRLITPQSSTESDPTLPTEEIHIYENVARTFEPLRNPPVDNRLQHIPVSSGDPDRIVSVREPVESTHPYDDDLSQNRSSTPQSNLPVSNPSQYLCKRCLNEFDVEMDFLCHIEKCLID
ncbi:centrosomal protein of 55 kDa-like [Pecten maximus]|uniref:centrosomal protein of 55 kDa-like n=1 Tax=Pecten maximus TaxID=6579 RepID=UPI001458B282|nr:centrosomal protein of 55 kDa-like [Pecten maximus]